MRKAINLFIVSILSFLHFQVTAQFTNTQLQNVTNRTGEEYRQVQFADLDNDGDQDLIVLRETQPYLIFKKEGTEFIISDSITFDNEFGRFRIEPFTVGDFDQDGLLDIAVTGQLRIGTIIFKNEGNVSFSPMEATEIGINTSSERIERTKDSEFVDFDNDGDRDLLVTIGDSFTNCGNTGVRAFLNNRLFENIGNNQFSEVQNTDIETDFTDTEAAYWVDYDGDNDLDLINLNVCSVRAFQNNENTLSLVSLDLPSVSGLRSMEWADYNHDGLIDILAVGTGSVFKNVGNGSFEAITLDEVEFPYSGKWFDADNDGDQDILIAYRNNEIALFTNNEGNFSKSILRNAGSRFTTFPLSIELKDQNEDGFLDFLVAGVRNSELSYYENTFNNGNHYVDLLIKGSNPNHTTDNVTVSVYNDEQVQNFYYSNQVGTYADEEILFHVGTGSAVMIDSVIVKWGSGMTQVIKDISADQQLSIVETAPPVPSTPENLTVDVLSHRGIEIRWDDSDFESGYILEINNVEMPDLNISYTLFKGLEFFFENELTPSTEYQVRLKAFNDSGESAFTTFNITTQEPPPAPEAPTDLTEIYTGYRTVSFSWTDNSDIETNYIVERSADNSAFTTVAELDANQTTYQDETVAQETTYFYRVKAENERIASGFTNTIEVTTLFTPFSEANTILTNEDLSNSAILDIDGDNDLDIVNIDFDLLQLIEYYNDGAGNFTRTVGVTEEGLDLFGATLFQVTDLDKDNKFEITTSSNRAGQFGLIKEEGVWKTSLVEIGKNINITRGIIGDYNHDTKTDVLTSIFRFNIGTIDIRNNTTENFSIDFEPIYSTWINNNDDSYEDVIAVRRPGSNSRDPYVSEIFQYDSINKFDQIGIDLTTEEIESISAFDFDLDKDDDIILRIDFDTRIYRNTGNNTYELFFEIDGSRDPFTIVDINNDGFPDLLRAGIVLINQNGENFVNSNIDFLPDLTTGRVLAEDLDNDGDIDLIYRPFNSQSVNRVFLNNWIEKTGKTNNAPDTPTGLMVTNDGFQNTLQWNASNDDHVPANAITYNMIIRDEAGIVMSPLADITSGNRVRSVRANVGAENAYTLNCLPNGNYEYAVQAIDPSGKPSPFSEFVSFTIDDRMPETPTNISMDSSSTDIIVLSWSDNASNEDFYIVERKLTDDDVFDFREIARLNRNADSYTDKGLQARTKYTYRIKAINCAEESSYSQELEAETKPFALELDMRFSLPDATGKKIELADFDNDGLLDIMVFYESRETSQERLEIYKNAGDSFLRTITIPGLSSTDRLTISDINQDGFLDIYLVSSSNGHKLFVNQKGEAMVENPSPVTFPDNLRFTSGTSWVDIDNDGDLDMIAILTLLIDNRLESSLNIFYQKEDAEFEMIKILDRDNSAIDQSFIDFNNDGFKDIILRNGSSGSTLTILKNLDGKEFEPVEVFTGEDNLRGSRLTLLDINGDQLLDLLFSIRGEFRSFDRGLFLMINEGDETFERILRPVLPDWYLERTTNPVVLFGDFLNDGSPELFINSDFIDNDGNDVLQPFLFTEQGDLQYIAKDNPFNGVQFSNPAVAMGDLDQDGDLEILNSEDPISSRNTIQLYNNNTVGTLGIINERPQPPAELNTEISSSSVTLNWEAGTDDLTPADRLSYNVYLIKDGADTLLLPLSNANGLLKISQLGNAQYNRFFILKGLKAGSYTWAVQSIDLAFRGSVFSETETFVLENDLTDEEPAVTNVIEGRNISFAPYPNPVNDFLRIKTGGNQVTNIQLTELSGKTWPVNYQTDEGSKIVKINTEFLLPGLYILSFDINGSSMQYKVVKSH
ncbi:MAG: FG-GAP-like repeat-containing protein [Bacteroidota bacterium]